MHNMLAQLDDIVDLENKVYNCKKKYEQFII